MKLDLQWRDAMAVRSAALVFTSAEKAEGWPACMAPKQLAALQRPYVYGDRPGREFSWSLTKALIAACEAGTIEHTATTSRVQVASEQNFVPTSLSRNWPSQYCIYGEPRAYTRPAQFKDVTHYHIAAPAFATWLAVQEVEPSPHIAAWFKALGVVRAVAGAGGVQGGESPSVVLSLVQNPTQPPEVVVAVPSRVPQKSMKPEWTGEKLAQRRQGLSGRDKSKQLSTETGLPEREITRREKAWRDEKINASKAANGTRH